MSDLQGNIDQFMEITGLDRKSAENILKINNYNLERAINYHLENDIEYAGASCSNSSNQNQIAATAAPPPPTVDPNSAVSEGASLPDDEDNIRAPIPPKREQLLMPEEDNFRYRKRRAPVFTVCPLRNFAHEAEMQEQQLSWYMENRETSRNLRHRPKRSRLDDLFCPPIELLFWGSFQAAREHATSQNRWLIVNLQDNAEFKSQILNRDIWPDPELKDLIMKYFVLWQVSVDNAEGLRFKAFYHVDTMPYVCIIDPRTGEEKLSCDVVTPQTFRADLLEFLNANLFSLEPSEQNVLNPYISGPSTSKNVIPRSSTITRPSQQPPPTSSTTTSASVPSSSTSSQPSSSSTSNSKKCDYHQMSELSEEDQLELAIKNSLKETRAPMPNSSGNTYDNEIVLDDNSSDNEVHFISDSENEAAAAADTYEKYLGDKNDPQTKIQLRLPAGERVQLEWSKTSKLRAIRLYIDSKYPDIAKDPYKLITAFPRKNILELDDKMTLDDAKLHPTSILHLHPDD